MKADLVFYVALALLASALSYFVSECLLFPLLITPIYLLCFFFLLRPSLQKGAEKERKAHEAFVFVDAFLISLSVSGSLDRAFASANEKCSGELRTYLDSLSAEAIPERLRRLESYFLLSRYRMFLSLFELYEEQGGDVLKIASNLLAELTRVEENAVSKRKSSFANLFQYGTLWTLSLGILAFLRFGLANFFETLVQSRLYLLCLAVYFAFFLFSILVYGFSFYGERPSFPLRRRPHEAASK